MVLSAMGFDKFLTREGAANLLKVKVGTIDMWRRTEWQEDLHYFYSGRSIRFYEDCIGHWFINRNKPSAHRDWLLDRHSSGTSRSLKLPA
jgi:hypothetical protein